MLRNIRKLQGLRNKVATCHASVLLLKISPANETALTGLKEFGYSGKKIQFIESAIKKDISRLNFLEQKNKKEDEQEVISFWELVADIEEARGFQLDVQNMSLERWISMIKQIKKKNERLKKNGRRSKHKSKR